MHFLQLLKIGADAEDLSCRGVHGGLVNATIALATALARKTARNNIQNCDHTKFWSKP
jgi:hypothetical protein